MTGTLPVLLWSNDSLRGEPPSHCRLWHCLWETPGTELNIDQVALGTHRGTPTQGGISSMPRSVMEAGLLALPEGIALVP